MNQVFQAQSVEPWHLLSVSDVIDGLQTSADLGLSDELAQERLQTYGPNLFPEAKARSKFNILINQFKSLPVALLCFAAALSIVTNGLADAAVIMGVIIINAVIGYATESQSESIIHSLKHLVQPLAAVIRAGKIVEIKAQEIVLGDVLVLKPGCYIAADARLINTNDLSVDESALTGESLPVIKTVKPLLRENLPLGDRTNMVYRGTLVTGGQGVAVVVATGAFTEMGHIQALVAASTISETPIERQLDQVSSQLVILSSLVCGVVFALGLLRGYDLLQMLKTSISLAVAAVPEGLPAVATTTLALGIREMRRHKVLIRRLDAVETLGSVQALCLDKTGTLTLNKMSVIELYAEGHHIHISEAQWKQDAEWNELKKKQTFLMILKVIVLCNESEVNGISSQQFELKGSSTENALLELAIAAGIDIKQIRQMYPRFATQHRSVDHNVMMTWHQISSQEDELGQSDKKDESASSQLERVSDRHTQAQFIAVKGSPLEVLSRSNWYLQNGEVKRLSSGDRSVIELENEHMAGQALRVLGIAYCDVSRGDDADLQNNLIWLGLVGMADPIRPGTKELIQLFHRAGIETIMITGDQRSTAYAIGKELNLNHNSQLQILDSTCFANLSPEKLQALCEKVQIFARISPAYKLQVIQALQRTGKIVAMTGDGVNDAPALKVADVGVAMGHVGTDVAREVADVILEDDNLQTMAISISRGRTIYNNIRKAVHFLLSTNLSEILVMLTAISFGLGQPLNAIQLLWLNLVTDIFPGLALALEAPATDVLSQPPRNPKEPIIRSADFKRIFFEATILSVSALGAYVYAIAHYGISLHASTIAFMSLTLAQLFHSLSCRSTTRHWGKTALPPNPYLAIALIGSLSLQLLSAIVPQLRHLLHLSTLGFSDIVIITISALLPLLVNEGTKKSA